MSAPISPGDFNRPIDTASVTTTISRAPAAWAASAILVTSVAVPKTFGVWTTTQAVSWPICVDDGGFGVERRGQQLQSRHADGVNHGLGRA